jgi:hypothetical protein
MLFSYLPVSAIITPTDQPSFLAYLDDIGTPTESEKGLDACYKTYTEYGHLVVYGTPWGPEGRKLNLKTNSWEYRYLGYTVNDQPYTNSKFPNDVEGSRSPLQWVYNNVNGATVSWGSSISTEQRDHMRTSSLTFEKTPYSGLTADFIGNTNLKPELRGYNKQSKIQSPASWKNGFSLYTLHDGLNGKQYYATFYGPDMGGGTDVNCSISTPSSTYTIKADQQSVTVPVTVLATAVLQGTYVKPYHIQYLRASILDSNNEVTGPMTTSTAKKDYVISRSQFSGPGSYPVTVTGNAEMQSSLSKSDYYKKQASKTITVIVEGIPGAYVEVTATANPSKKQVDATKDELVTVTVNAALKGYADTSNIKEWAIFAELDGEKLTTQNIITPGGTLTSNASFTFTVLKSKFISNNFLQSFRTTAIARLNRAIGATTFYQGVGFTQTEFYKIAPVPDPMPVPEPEPDPDPVAPNIPPVAVLGYQDTVRAGEETMVDSLSSYDTDGYIAEYNVYTPDANVINTDEGLANVWYPYTGIPTVKYRVAARVKDNRGAANGTTGYITVTEPTIEAKIAVSGKLKVNRHVAIVSASDSPERYPIDNTKTVWTLQAVSGGTNADIKFNGVLTGVNTINAIFKKQGVYRATLSVTNTLGFTGTVTYLINIGPDLKPAANYETATSVLRDVKDYGYATIELLDTSYSLDGDIINSRIWSYAWDSNNNGSFADETYKIFDSGNNTKPILKVTNVGKYNIKLLVKETFTDTLPLYILPTDYLSDDTVDKPLTESVVEVINIAPTTAFSMINKKKVDLIFNVWDTKHTVAEIQSKINSAIIPAMSENNIDAQIALNSNYNIVTNNVAYNSSWSVSPGYSSKRDDPDYEYDPEYELDYTFPVGYTTYSYVSTAGGYGDSYNINKTDSKNAFQTFLLYDRAGKSFQFASSTATENSVPGVIKVGSETVSRLTYRINTEMNSTLYIKSFKIEGGKIYLTATGIFINWCSTSSSVGQNVIEFQNKEFVITPTGIDMNNLSHITTRVHLTRSQGANANGSGTGNQIGVLSSMNDNSKYMETLLTEYTPRTNSKPYLITIADNQLKELADPQKSAKVLSQTLEKNINFTALGTTTNKTQLENYRISNNNHGIFIDNTNLDTAITSLKDYILGIENQEEPKTQYVALGEDLEYLTFYDDYEDDVKYAEQWKYTHTNPNYFDNALGIDPQSGINRTLPITKFDRVGLYEASLRVRDNPYNNSFFNNYKLWSRDEAMQFIVHRRPIADFIPYVLYNSATSKYYISTVDKSYDLDHSISRVDKGIRQKQWKWKFAEDIVWQLGIPAEIINGKTYILQLMVQDIEGAWSLPTTDIVSLPDILLYANPTSLPWQNKNAVVNLSVIVNNGIFSRVDYKWTNDTTRPITGLISSTNINNNLTQTMTNEWYLHATAYTVSGQSAYNYFGPYLIDKIAPTIVVDKTNAESIDPITVNVTIGDAGGSGIKDVKYKWTNSIAKPASGWSIANDCFSTTQEDEGIWYLHVEATDNAGNITYDYFGIYKVDSFILEKFRVVMVRDVQLEDYYYNNLTGRYDDIPMYVNKMALDDVSFGSMITGLTKGYKFEFEIDSRNFNEAVDTIIIEPHFFTTDGFARDAVERDLYWEDSSHQIFKAGEGGHASWKTIKLAASNRIIRTDREATWRGEYLIPGSAWAVPEGTMKAQAKAKDLKKDIIVNFHIIGYKDGKLQFDYNADQWGKERTTGKYPYLIGDVIRYSWDKNCLDDINAKDNR